MSKFEPFAAFGFFTVWILGIVSYFVGLVTSAQAGSWVLFVFGMIFPPVAVVVGFIELLAKFFG